LLLCNPLGTVLTIRAKKNICWERYDELENGTCCLRCRDPGAYFKPKEVDNNTKPLTKTMHYITGVHFNIVMYDLTPAMLRKPAAAGEQSSRLHKPALGRRRASHPAPSPCSTKLKRQLMSSFRSKQPRFKLTSCFLLQHGDSQRESVSKAAKK